MSYPVPPSASSWISAQKECWRFNPAVHPSGVPALLPPGGRGRSWERKAQLRGWGVTAADVSYIRLKLLMYSLLSLPQAFRVWGNSVSETLTQGLLVWVPPTAEPWRRAWVSEVIPGSMGWEGGSEVGLHTGSIREPVTAPGSWGSVQWGPLKVVPSRDKEVRVFNH